MPAYRIVYTRDEASGPEATTASFANLDQALNTFAARGLRILYIAETGKRTQPLEALVHAVQERRDHANGPERKASSFPLRRFSARAMA